MLNACPQVSVSLYFVEVCIAHKCSSHRLSCPFLSLFVLLLNLLARVQKFLAFLFGSKVDRVEECCLFHCQGGVHVELGEKISCRWSFCRQGLAQVRSLVLHWMTIGLKIFNQFTFRTQQLLIHSDCLHPSNLTWVPLMQQRSQSFVFSAIHGYWFSWPPGPVTKCTLTHNVSNELLDYPSW